MNTFLTIAGVVCIALGITALTFVGIHYVEQAAKRRRDWRRMYFAMKAERDKLEVLEADTAERLDEIADSYLTLDEKYEAAQTLRENDYEYVRTARYQFLGAVAALNKVGYEVTFNEDEVLLTPIDGNGDVQVLRVEVH